MSHNLRLWVVDVTVFTVFLLVMDVPLTGLPIHEWLGIGIGAALVVHLVQHGNWVATVTDRFRSATSFRNRLNYVMMAVLFLSFVTIIVSGLVISEAAIPWLGIQTAYSPFWLWVHLSSVNVVLLATALHLALNWRWIANSFNRYVAQPLRVRSARRQPHLVYPTTENS